jgi:hypothetical protein
MAETGASGTVTVQNMGSATIDGAGPTVVSDGSNWLIVGSN